MVQKLEVSDLVILKGDGILKSWNLMCGRGATATGTHKLDSKFIFKRQMLIKEQARLVPVSSFLHLSLASMCS